MGFVCFLFQIDIWLSRLSSQNLETIQYNNIECLRLGTIALIVARWKFDVLKTSIFAQSKLCFSGKYLF